jgi:hypothetical protein
MDGKSLGATLSCNKAPSKPASNSDVIVRKPIDSEVLSKLSVLKTVPSELASPITVGFELIDHHGTLFAIVTSAWPSPSTNAANRYMVAFR